MNSFLILFGQISSFFHIQM